jgi:hypothetical protein
MLTTAGADSASQSVESLSSWSAIYREVFGKSIDFGAVLGIVIDATASR